MNVRSVKIVVSGKVQGVWFRASAQQQANRLGVTGWVKNLADGSVEILASGADEAVAQFIAWCHQGPSLAKVEKVAVTELNHHEAFNDFAIVGK